MNARLLPSSVTSSRSFQLLFDDSSHQILRSVSLVIPAPPVLSLFAPNCPPRRGNGFVNPIGSGLYSILEPYRSKKQISVQGVKVFHYKELNPSLFFQLSPFLVVGWLSAPLFQLNAQTPGSSFLARSSSPAPLAWPRRKSGRVRLGIGSFQTFLSVSWASTSGHM